MSKSNPSLSENLRSDFDDSFKYIQSGSKKVPFSSERILTDLLDSGIKMFDAFDILYECKRAFHVGINIVQVTKLLNEAIITRGYTDNNLIRGNTVSLVVEYPDYEEFLNFKQIKHIVADQLIEYEYSSKTYKLIVEELYRILQSLRMNRFKIDNIHKMIPSVTRSVIEIDPFDSQVTTTLFRRINRQFERLSENWQYLAKEEQPIAFLEFFSDVFAFLLLWFNHLPGHNFVSTVSQINSLISQISGEQSYLSESELYNLGKVATSLQNIVKDHKQQSMAGDIEWMRESQKLMDLVVRFQYQGAVKWIVLLDKYNRELYTRFSSSSRIKYQSMVGMAISGIHSLLNEVTDDSINMIEQQDGAIVIEGREEFRMVIFLSERLNPRLTSVLKLLALTIEETMQDMIKEFRGEVKAIELLLDPVISEYLGILFVE